MFFGIFASTPSIDELYFHETCFEGLTAQDHKSEPVLQLRLEGESTFSDTFLSTFQGLGV